MKKFVNGEYIGMTAAEIAALEADSARHEAAERTRPLTAEEVSALLIRQHINTLSVDDNTALRMLEFYPEWNDRIGQTVDKAEYKFQHNGKLYKTIPRKPYLSSGLGSRRRNGEHLCPY